MWAGVHLWGDGEIGSRRSPMRMRYRTWMYTEETKASTHPTHDATRNSPFCPRGAWFLWGQPGIMG